MNQSNKLQAAKLEHRFSFRVSKLANIPLFIHSSFFALLAVPFLPCLEVKLFNFPFLFPLIIFACAFFHGLAKFLYFTNLKINFSSAVMYPFGVYLETKNTNTKTPAQFFWYKILLDNCFITYCCDFSQVLVRK